MPNRKSQLQPHTTRPPKSPDGGLFRSRDLRGLTAHSIFPASSSCLGVSTCGVLQMPCFQVYHLSQQNETPLRALVLNLEPISLNPKLYQKASTFPGQIFFNHLFSCLNCENSRVKICFSQKYFHKKVRIKFLRLKFSQKAGLAVGAFGQTANSVLGRGSASFERCLRPLADRF